MKIPRNTQYSKVFARMQNCLLKVIGIRSVRGRKCLIIKQEEIFEIYVFDPISRHNDNAFMQLLIYNIDPNTVLDVSKEQVVLNLDRRS